MAWTAQEDLLLIAAVRHLGSNWSVIAGVLPGRTADGLRNHWYRLQKQPTNPVVFLLLNKLFGVSLVGKAIQPAQAADSAVQPPGSAYAMLGPPGAQAAPLLPTVYGVPCNPAPAGADPAAPPHAVNGTSAPAAQKRKLEGDAAADAAHDELALLRREVASLKAENQKLRDAPRPPMPPVAAPAVVGPRTPTLGAGSWSWGDHDDSLEEGSEGWLGQLADSLQDEDLSSSFTQKLCVEAGGEKVFGKYRRSSSAMSLTALLEISDGKGRRGSEGWLGRLAESLQDEDLSSSFTQKLCVEAGGENVFGKCRRSSSVMSLTALLEISDGKGRRSSVISLTYSPARAASGRGG